jgi:diguanylate cyclase (GGDEF)-like protein/PAS domain S-box-containing protein
LTYAVITAFRVVELGIPIGMAQFGVQFGTYLLAGAVLNQILPEMEAMRSRELDLYEPVLMAQDAAGEAVLITEDGRPVFFNKAFAALSGHAAAELGRVPVSELIATDLQALTDAEPRLPFGGEVLTRDGRRTAVEISYRRSLKDGRERAVWILRDAATRGQGEDPPMHDTLTGLPNGGLFKKRAADALSWAQRKERQMSLLVVGLDEVEEVHHALGRAARDEILIDIATRLSRALRESDLAARTGSAQFAALLLDTPAAGAEHVAQNLLRIIGAPVAIDGEPVSMGATIGISVYPTHAQEIDGLLGRAEAAMSAARQARTGWRTAE